MSSSSSWGPPPSARACGKTNARTNMRFDLCVLLPDRSAVQPPQSLCVPAGSSQRMGSSREVIESGPVLTIPLTTLLMTPPGGENIDDPGPPRLSISASKCVSWAKFHPNPTSERLFRHETAAPWSDLGEIWPTSNDLMWRLRESKSRRPWVAPGPRSSVFANALGRQKGRRKRSRQDRAALDPLEDPSVRGDVWPPNESRPPRHRL